MGSTTPSGGSYTELAERFAPVFARIAEGALERELGRTLPFEQVGWLKEAGFGRIRVPAEYGGFGASVETLVRLLVGLSAADSSVGHLLRSHFAFVETISLQDEAFRARWFGRVVDGVIFGNAATERSGNALGTVATRLVPADGGWLLTGEKYYTTGTIFADYVAVMASPEGKQSRLYAIAPTRHAGVEIRDDWDGFGQQMTGTGTAVFREVPIPAEDAVPRTESTTHEPAFLQLMLLSVLAGIGQAVVRDASALVAKRTRTFSTGSGQLFREDPLILNLVGQLAAKSFAAESSVLAAARELDAALALGPDASAEDRYARGAVAVDLAQVAVPPLVIDAAQQLFDTAGASAVSRGKALDRHWRNARTVATHNPVAFKARGLGDWFVNRVSPVALHSIGEATATTA
ncbi:acyl-CoA dehydrogenase [Sinomonas cellulolyticus]|uniref:Dibenzothiophene monooxygenase n=1 Tax=Sinomonas cellulolyticus TaxID=2801916 RepID=A0ABS1K408_9MICC|nr:MULTISPECIES: acyl-CoA dehydrogenase family protein [Sinomonas]MBL0706012.1 acyl-CoA dehydrogenase family protein [Sinomonas cellulolyticus]GHG43044.1 acyl-CoA dehydrogenase [Sinomonas sp. KCTC 49339]